MNAEEVWYFAYGSNLNVGQMMSRVGEWMVAKRAILSGHRLVFDVPSKRWGGLAANIVQTDNHSDKVYGAVYLISTEKLSVLTRYEGRCPSDVRVESDGETVSAKAYVFDKGEPGEPPDAYLNVMLTGLRQHGYPEDMIEELKNAAKSRRAT